jgi:putative tryptophan/tyrosine transport system substrate-binding protein
MASHLERRKFLAALGGAAAAWPLAARAQQGERVRRVGVLMGILADDPQARARAAAFVKGLQARGWVDGRNLSIDYRWTAGEPDHMRAQAAELVATAPDIIIAFGSAGVQAVQPQTRTIPVVFVNAPDPVNLGFVASLARPGGNITGFTGFEPSMAGKWLEGLKEIAPKVTRVAVLFHPDLPAYRPRLRVIEALAPSLGVTAVPASARDTTEIERVIETFATGPSDGLIVQPGVFTTANREFIVSVAARHRLPAAYPFRYFVTAGGLISYGLDIVDLYRQDFKRGAGVWVPYGTAYHALYHSAKAHASETVLVHGASGGVGIAALQIARAMGLKVFGTAGTPSGLEMAKREGAHRVFDHRTAGYQEELLQATGNGGVDIILEMLANVNLSYDTKLLANNGRIIVIGSRGEVTINPRELMARRASIRAFTLWATTAAEEADIHAGLLAGFENGTLRPVVGKEMPLAEAARAHKEILEPGSVGKIVLICSS